LGQAEKLLRERAGQRADDSPVGIAETQDARGPEREAFDRRAQPNADALRKNVGEIIVPLQHVESRAECAGDDLAVLIEERRNDGTKLAQAREQFLFEIRRLRREVLHAEVDEMPLPELGRATPADMGRALKDVDGDARRLQRLGTTEARQAGSDNRDRTKFLHRGNVTIRTQGAIILTRAGRISR
jgi:hypothetical protein